MILRFFKLDILSKGNSGQQASPWRRFYLRSRSVRRVAKHRRTKLVITKLVTKLYVYSTVVCPGEGIKTTYTDIRSEESDDPAHFLGKNHTKPSLGCKNSTWDIEFLLLPSYTTVLSLWEPWPATASATRSAIKQQFPTAREIFTDILPSRTTVQETSGGFNEDKHKITANVRSAVIFFRPFRSRMRTRLRGRIPDRVVIPVPGSLLVHVLRARTRPTCTYT